MIAKYMDCEYTYASNRRCKEIITSQKEKVKDGFISEKEMYYKTVNEDELTDIYSVHFWVRYETELEGVSDWWKLDNEQNVIVDNQVKLIFAEGILPEWNIIDKNVCSTMVPLDKVLEAKIVISYWKKEGISFNERVDEERIISIEELKQLHKGYCRANL